jgi:hypothetical protein
MKTISQTAAAIKYFEAAIDGLRESMNREVEKDKDILNFKKKVKEINKDIQFVFYPHYLEFCLSEVKMGEAKYEITRYFFIRDGKVEFSEENSFDGIEDVAKEAQKITQKYFTKED